jgi:rhodanese-related sulfurtransferase
MKTDNLEETGRVGVMESQAETAGGTATVSTAIGGQSTMAQVLERYPGAQRALFRHYHIGGCRSCGFQPQETLAGLCARNNNLDVAEVIGRIQSGHEQDLKMAITPIELQRHLEQCVPLKLLDIRSREEWDATHIEGAVLLTQQVMQEILSHWPKDHLLVIYDHLGQQSLDAAAYFAGHGFTQARHLQGGIDAWAEQIAPSLPRYRLE